MTAPAARQAASVAAKTSPVAWLKSVKVLSLAEKFDEHRTSEQETELRVQQAAEAVAGQAPARQEIIKSFSLHLGADIPIPTSDKRKTHVVDESPASELSSATDPFDGLPLKAWAERMGERVMPAYELVRDEQKKAKLAAKSAPPQEASMPAIPHLLPFTRWASKSEEFRDTFIAGDAKSRKKARLSWYHPDDTMVPRNWFKGGLLEDLKYYAPFSRSKAKETQ